jgi:hypothetical protein
MERCSFNRLCQSGRTTDENPSFEWDLMGGYISFGASAESLTPLSSTLFSNPTARW